MRLTSSSAFFGEAEPQQAKALLRELVVELRVNGKAEILPAYRLN